MNKSYNLQLTKQEIEALQNYAGFMHARMNAIADLKYDKLEVLQKSGWDMNMSTEELEKMILKFVDVYGAIYKAGNREARGRLYRGTSTKKIRKIEHEKNINSFLSTSLEEDMAKNFTTYGDEAAILRIKTEEGLPYLYVEPYKEDGRKDEEEILILPFSKVKKIEHTSDWNGYKYYDAILEKEELEEVPKQELETLKSQTMEGYDYYREQATKCSELKENVEYMYMKLRQSGLSGEDKNYLYEQIQEKTNRYTELEKNVSEYQKQFSRMLKGMCKEKEIEIDKEHEEEQERIKEEQRIKNEEQKKELEADIKRLETEIQCEKINIGDTLEEYVRRIEENSRKYQTMADDLKIDYSMNPHFRNLENIQAIKKMLEEKEEGESQEEKKKNQEQEKKEEQESQENQEQEEQELQENDVTPEEMQKLSQRYEMLLGRKQKLLGIKQVMGTFPQYIAEHDRQSFEEINRNLNQKIQNMITRTKLEKLQREKEVALKEKDSRLQKWLYGTSLKEARISNIGFKMELEKRQAKTRNSEKNVWQMMANLYDCCAQDLDGQFSPEMVETIYAMRRNFKDLPDENILAQQAYEKAQGNYPAVLDKKRPSKRKQIAYYQEDTERVKAEIYSMAYYKPIKQEVEVNALSQFEQGIENIRSTIESKEPTYARQAQTENVI